LGLSEEVVPITWKYSSILFLEKMRRDNMNFSMIREELEESEEIVTTPHLPIDQQEGEVEEEEEDPQEPKELLNNQPKLWLKLQFKHLLND
jgi:hypothetical protein